jgi:hypothetical protein
MSRESSEMSERSRLETRDQLLVEVGFLLDPIRRLLFANPYNPIPKLDRLRLRQSLNVDRNAWYEVWNSYCHYHGVMWHEEHGAAVRILMSYPGTLIESLEYDHKGEPLARIRSEFNSVLADLVEAINAMPVDVPDMILPANSPFQAYRLFRSLCSGAKRRIDLFDPYVDASVYYRYLSDLQPDVDVRIITDENCMKNAAVRDRIVAVSQVFAQERPDHYWLLVAKSLHDRHLRVDDELFHLGGSLKDAARKDAFSLGKLDASDEAIVRALDGLLASATPWYEPGITNHKTS